MSIQTRCRRTAAQPCGIVMALALWLVGGFRIARPVWADLNEQVAKFDSNTATLEDVLRVFGGPTQYTWSGKTLAKDKLPAVYILAYPNNFSVLMNHGAVEELRFEGPATGFVYRGKLKVGSSLEDVFSVLGRPTETVEGGSVDWRSGVLYKDMEGRKGSCYYSRPDQGIRLFFADYKVSAIYVTCSQRAKSDQAGGGPLIKLSDRPAGPLAFPKVDRRPEADDFGRGQLAALPKHNPGSENPFEVDLRSYDLSRLDLRAGGSDLSYASFDARTKWPPAERMPAAFDTKRITDLGRNPGLGVRSLHAQGITGRGVGIAIVDNPLLVDHAEYAERLRLYEETNVRAGTPAHMHGPAVASIAVGKTVGVAPEADLYYIGRWALDLDSEASSDEGKPALNFQYDAAAIDRILQINDRLPKDRKIRVISISIGWDRSQKGYAQVTTAVQQAKAAGMLVICSSVEEIHGFKFHGLGRELTSNPDDFNSYRPAGWGKAMYAMRNRLLVPMDARTTASPTGKNEYVFYGVGGWSWAIPYIAGVYALAAQVEPAVTPERFWALALKTGRTIELKDGGTLRTLGPVVDPVKLIAALRAGELSDPQAAATELGRSQAPSTGQKDIAAQVAQLDINKATRADVVKLFGAPVSYLWDNQTYEPNDLPERYVMVYSDVFGLMLERDRIGEVRFHTSDSGYAFRGALRIGSTLAEALKVLGPPTHTITGQKNEWQDGVLYKDIGGTQGYHYYARQDQGIRVFLMNDRVLGLFLTRTEPLPERK